MRGPTIVCLIEIHKAQTVADLLNISNRICNETHPYPHIPSQWCLCRECVCNQTKKCKNPHECAKEVLVRIQIIYPVKNPLHLQSWHSDLSLTSSRKRMNVLAKFQNETILFDPSITNKKDLSECFCIFMDLAKTQKALAQHRITPGTALQHQKLEVYTDRACTNNGKKKACYRSGTFFMHNDPRNQAIHIPGEQQSNQVGELAAIITAIQATPTFHPLVILSDSKYAINRLTITYETGKTKGGLAPKTCHCSRKQPIS
jgi:hypothetical protein